MSETESRKTIQWPDHNGDLHEVDACYDCGDPMIDNSECGGTQCIGCGKVEEYKGS